MFFICIFSSCEKIPIQIVRAKFSNWNHSNWRNSVYYVGIKFHKQWNSLRYKYSSFKKFEISLMVSRVSLKAWSLRRNLTCIRIPENCQYFPGKQIIHSLILRKLINIPTYNILQAAESGNLEEFIRLYQGDNGRLMVKDARGRTAAHQASSRNRVNILQYIYAQQSSEYKFRRIH